MTASVTFETTVTAMGNNTGIVVPKDMIERLGAGGRPPLLVEVNGYQCRYTVHDTGPSTNAVTGSRLIGRAPRTGVIEVYSRAADVGRYLSDQMSRTL